MVSEPPLGIYCWHEPLQPKVDLVAVHGLGGTIDHTWTHAGTKTCWLKDLLPDRLKDARILAFGYNAKRMNHRAEVDFEDVATQLLQGLRRFRQQNEEKQRSIIFVAHSLGGLVVKKAVTLTSPLARDIASRVHAFVFFASPHRGSSLATTAVSVLKIPRGALIWVHCHYHYVLATNVCMNREALGKQFLATVERYNTACVSFYEINKTRAPGFWPPFQRMIVKKHSAILGMNGETTIPLNSDHSNIVRFRSAEDNNFRVCLDLLQTLLRDLKNDTPRPASLKHREPRLFVPTLSRYYVGRHREHQKLRELFLPSYSPPPRGRTVALFGQTGVGKSQLALKYASSARASYDYIIMLDSPSRLVLQAELTTLHRKLKLPGAITDAIGEITTWLARTDIRWLLIFDNANDLMDIEPIVSSLSPYGHCIITTQDARSASSELLDAAIEVPLLTSVESIELLFNNSSNTKGTRPEPDEAAPTLVQELGRLPLAIDSARAYMHVQHKTAGEYLALLRQNPKDILSHRPELTSHPSSVLTSLELSFNILDADARVLMNLFTFLDRAEITEDFLQEGVAPQDRYLPSGNKTSIGPGENKVPRELIQIISHSFRFDAAVEQLTSLSMVQCSKSEDRGRIFSVHPLTYMCARLRMLDNDARVSLIHATYFTAHAYPGRKKLRIENMEHVFSIFRNLKDLGERLVAREATEPHPITENVALLFIPNIRYHIEHGNSEKVWEMVTWISAVLEERNDVYLSAKIFELSAAMNFYHTGHYTGGIDAIEAFLADSKAKLQGRTIDGRTNAQLGFLKFTLAEYYGTEAGTNGNFEAGIGLFKDWEPVDPEHVSTLERHTVAMRSRNLGKIFKDKGDWSSAAEELSNFLTVHSIEYSQAEGWAAGDLAQVLMELGKLPEAEAALLPQIEKRLRLIVDPLQGRRKTRKDDFMFLEIQLAELLVLQSRYHEAEATLIELKERFESFPDLVHFEKTRVFFVLCALARCAHMQNLWGTAVDRWNDVLSYATTRLDVGHQKGKWGRNSYFGALAALSLADAQYQLLRDGHHARRRKEAAERLGKCERMVWMLGLGTYWPAFLGVKLNTPGPV